MRPARHQIRRVSLRFLLALPLSLTLKVSLSTWSPCLSSSSPNEVASLAAACRASDWNAFVKSRVLYLPSKGHHSLFIYLFLFLKYAIRFKMFWSTSRKVTAQNTHWWLTCVRNVLGYRCSHYNQAWCSIMTGKKLAEPGGFTSFNHDWSLVRICVVYLFIFFK